MKSLILQIENIIRFVWYHFTLTCCLSYDNLSSSQKYGSVICGVFILNKTALRILFKKKISKEMLKVTKILYNISQKYTQGVIFL